MAAQAEALVKDYPELNFDVNNLPFLTNTTDTVKSLPTAKEKKQATEVCPANWARPSRSIWIAD